MNIYKTIIISILCAGSWAFAASSSGTSKSDDSPKTSASPASKATSTPSTLSTTTSSSSSKDRYADLQMFTKVLNLIEQHYVEEVDTKKLVYGAIKGMLSSLDPHTNFLPPDIFKEFNNETNGEFGGLGLEVTVQDDVLTVISPIEDTPAYKAGIKAGDKIIDIEGKTTKGMSLAEAVDRMRGKRGSSIKVQIWREGFEKPRQFVLKRDLVKIHSVKYVDLGDGYLYTRLTSFIKNTGDELADALNVQQKHYGKIKGVILDLRNNAGGLLEQAIKVSNLFVDHGVIVSTMGRNKKDKEVVYAKKEGAHTNFPLVVLMNEYSASASEIVGGCLKDHKRAVIMGERSFGKGSVQTVVDLGEGAGLKLTVARYYTPSGRSIQAQGIEPDIHLDSLDAQAYAKAVIHHKGIREADIEGHLENEDEVANEDSAKTGKNAGENFWIRNNLGPKDEAKKDDDLSPKEKLLKGDYQISQAYNYLRAGFMFDEGDKPSEQKADLKANQRADQRGDRGSHTPASESGQD